MRHLHSDPTRGVPQHARRTSAVRSALLGAVALAIVQPAFAQAPQNPAPAQSGQTQPPLTAPPATMVPSFADVVDRVKPAVVSVRAKGESVQTSRNESGGGRNFNLPDFNLPDDHPFQEFFRRFRGGPGGQDNESQGPRPGPSPRRGISQGSGFFISADGYLVTNNHVIDRSSEVEVLMDDGRTLSAKVVGTDPKTDLALLKVEEGGPFKYVELAPEVPRVGDWVLAIGNPFGLGGTVTAGIISARARDIGAGPYDDFLQIDAPVNRGNSGGPTFNQRGQVVGVNTAIASPSGGNVGIAFAIPSETVRNVVTQLREKGFVERGFLGVQIQSVTNDIASSIGLQNEDGAIVSRLEENSPAAKAGIKTGDVILSVNGSKVEDARDLSRMVASLSAGSTATLEIWRNGQRQQVSVNIGRMSDSTTASAQQTGGDTGKLGLKLAPSTGGEGTDVKGVAVIEVQPGSTAAEKGFRTGDVIAEVAGRQVQTPADVSKALEESRKEGKKSVLFRVEAQNGARFIAVPVPAA